MDRRQRTRFVAMLSVAVSLLVAGAGWTQAPQIPPDKPTAELLPAGTLLMIEGRDIGATRQRAQLNAFVKSYNAPAVQEYFKPLVSKINEGMGLLDMMLQGNLGMNVADLGQLVDGRAALALTSVTPVAGPSGVKAVVIVAPKDAAALKATVDKLLARIPPEARKGLVKRKVAGVEVTEMPGMPATAWATAGNALVVGIGDKTVDEVIQRALRGGSSLAQEPTFAAVNAKLKSVNQDWMLYAQIEKPLQLVKALAGPTVETPMQHLGVEQFKAFAIAGKLDGPAIDDALFLYAPGAQGKLLNAVAPKPVDPQLLRAVPANVGQFSIMRMNLPLIWDTVVGAAKTIAPDDYADFAKDLEEANKELGLSVEADLVRALGEEAIAYAIPTATADFAAKLKAAKGADEKNMAVIESSYGSVVALLSVKNADQIRKSLAALCAKGIEQAKAGGPEYKDISLAGEDYQGVAINALKGLPKAKLTPAYAVTDKYLILGGSTEIVKTAIDQAAGRGKGDVTTSKMWEEAKPRIPTDAGLISVGDGAAGIDQAILTLTQVWLPQVAQLAMAGDKDVEQMLAKDPTPVIDAFKRNAITNWIFVKTEADGLLVQGHTPVGSVSVVPVGLIGGGAAGYLIASRMRNAMMPPMGPGGVPGGAAPVPVPPIR
jgi:hypothetical protein